MMNLSLIKGLSINVARLVNSLSSKGKKKQACKVSDYEKILSAICLAKESTRAVKEEFYCPVRYAKIYIHSIIADKLGDLTKFIISSLYSGHTIDEICALTQMGRVTINEEIEYLTRGKILLNDRPVLSELGKEYGELLQKIESFKNGIDVIYNEYTNLFEPIVHYIVDSPKEGRILANRFIRVLARNDNYSNSREIALKKLGSDLPFSRELKNSLYTSVKIVGETKYKVVSISDSERFITHERDNCIKVAVPYTRITYKPRYLKLRNCSGTIQSLLSTEDSMLSNKAKELIQAYKEEEKAESIVIEVNLFTETICNGLNDLITSVDESPFVLTGKGCSVGVDNKKCSGIYLDELEREFLFQICYYPYNRMEEVKNAEGESLSIHS